MPFSLFIFSHIFCEIMDNSKELILPRLDYTGAKQIIDLLANKDQIECVRVVIEEDNIWEKVQIEFKTNDVRGVKKLVLLGAKVSSPLFDSFKHMHELKELDLRGNSIGSHGASLLAEGVKCAFKLKTLYLNSNKLRFDGANSLSGALRNMGGLQKLDLSNNEIGPGFPEPLLEAFKQMDKLRILYLARNFIGSSEATSIANAIKQMRELKIILLSQNFIGDDGVASLACAFVKMLKLEKFDLTSNQFSKIGAKLLINAAKRMPELKSIWLNDESKPNNHDWTPLNRPMLSCAGMFWTHEALKFLKKEHKNMCKMLTTSKLSLMNAQMGAEYSLPDEMIEKIAGHLCPIVCEGFNWKFDYESSETPIFLCVFCSLFFKIHFHCDRF